MWGLRSRLAEVVGATGAARGWYAAVGSRRPAIRMLAYHRVTDDLLDPAFAGDPELVSASVADFTWQLGFVKRHFQPMRLADVVAALDAGDPLPPRCVVITFDDGHHDNYASAFPILRSLGMPATIFLSTDYMDQDRPFWFDRIARLVRGAPAGPLRIASLELDALLTDAASRAEATGIAVSRLKRCAEEPFKRALDEFEAVLGRFCPIPAGARFAVSWQEVAEMAAAGIEFGSHGTSHRVLTTLSDSELVRELAESRGRIREASGQSVDSIAYPVGTAAAFDSRVIAAVAASGYRIGLSYRSGINYPGALERFAMVRLHIERYVTRSQFETMLCLPGVLE